ncbi:uncharacterized protein DNG_05639 [Cephalotrichum gorgonifer]|uniref:Ecp2 effector protein-like domain-containing protein n=1 Tax=Cephalotrichum gorgonifer TaxID=2041049 RepID=A0AAE8N076_9PEZI|nr:uncharacterized protein DNG_05639 [Cephalotrichum gorgonifer]
MFANLSTAILLLAAPALLPTATAALPDASSSTPFPGAVAQTISGPSGNATVFVAGFYERPSPPLSSWHAKWIPFSRRKLCSLSTFSNLSSSSGDDADESNEEGTGDGKLAGKRDCSALRDWATLHHGHWVIPRRDLASATILVLGSCAVSVSVREEWRGRLPWGVAVSSEDVGKVVGEVVEKYVVDGGVGGKGNMGCLGWGSWEPFPVPVDWRIGGWAEEA